MQNEREAIVADAARYRWLRDVSTPPHNFYISVPDEFHGVRYEPSEVDAYIDAAIAALGQQTGSTGPRLALLPMDDSSRSVSDSLLPDSVVMAGADALEKADDDLRNYVAGETTDWDYGMQAVAVYRAMTEALTAGDHLKGNEHDR